MKAEVKKELWWVFIFLGIAILVALADIWRFYALIKFQELETHSFVDYILERKPYQLFFSTATFYLCVLILTRYVVVGIIILLKRANSIVSFLVCLCNLVLLIALCLSAFPILKDWFWAPEVSVRRNPIMVAFDKGLHNYELDIVIRLLYLLILSFIIQLIAIKSLIFSLSKRPKT